MQIIEKLSVSAPSPEARLSVLKEIAEEYNVVWDSFQTEAALNKKHEDLLVSYQIYVSDFISFRVAIVLLLDITFCFMMRTLCYYDSSCYC